MDKAWDGSIQMNRVNTNKTVLYLADAILGNPHKAISSNIGSHLHMANKT